MPRQSSTGGCCADGKPRSHLANPSPSHIGTLSALALFSLTLHFVVPSNGLLIAWRYTLSLTRALPRPLLSLPLLLLRLLWLHLWFRHRLLLLRCPSPIHSPIPDITLTRILLALRRETRVTVVTAIVHIVVCDVLVFDVAEGFVAVGGVFRVFGDDVPGVQEAGDVAEGAKEDVD